MNIIININNLYILINTHLQEYTANFLDLFSILSVFCAILVIINKNPIVSVLFLIGLFANISCYLIMIGLSFIGLSYLIVYIGAISILFLFILMLINIRISELQSSSSNSVFLGISIAIYFNYPVFQLLPYNVSIINNYNLNFILHKISFYFNYTKSSINSPNLDLNFVTSNI